MTKHFSIEAAISKEESLSEKASKTRFPHPYSPSPLNPEEKIEGIAHHFRAILELLGLDLSNESLEKTPERVAKMYVKELFSGLDPKTFPKLSLFNNDYSSESYPSLITTSASFVSCCEHHFLPIEGIAYIGYRPKNKIIGLSKIPRIVEHFAKRPQLQERLTAQIADALLLHLRNTRCRHPHPSTPPLRHRQGRRPKLVDDHPSLLGRLFRRNVSPSKISFGGTSSPKPPTAANAALRLFAAKHWQSGSKLGVRPDIRTFVPNVRMSGLTPNA